MKRRRLQSWAASIAAIVLVVGCAPPRPELGRAASGPVRESIVALERSAWEAWKRKDGKFFRDNLLADAAYMSGTGLSTREAIARDIETSNCTVESYVLRNQEVRSLSPDVALLTLRATSDVTCDSKPIHSDAWSTSVFVRVGDTWKVSFHQETDAAR